MIKALHHSGFVVTDLEKATEFYRDVVGLKVLDTRERTGEAISQVVGYEDCHLKAVDVGTGDGHKLELIEYVNPPAGERPSEERSVIGGSHLCFQVDDIDATFQRLVENGGQKMNPPVELAPGRLACYLRDPDGNWIELLELRS